MPTYTQSDFTDTTRINAGRRKLNDLHIDFPLLVGLLVMVGIGLLVLYSASEQDIVEVEKQIVRLTLAFAVMIVIAQLSPATLRHWSPWLFGIGLLMLIAVLLIGDVGKGAQRWLNLGFFRFQPSELMKLALPMLLAWYLSEAHLPPRFKHVITALILILLPTVLVAKQPDLGTSLLLASSGIFVLFLAGLRWSYIISSLILLIPASLLFWFYGMHEYQRQRVITFLNPESDPLGSGYHIIQSSIAIGSGGVYGKGWLNGTQSHLDFLPERTTDFIFAAFSEEFGLIGSLILLVIYSLIIARGFVIAAQAQDTFSRLLAGSITITFFIYVFINIGMVSGLLPVVGIPLPLVSRGGTSIVTLCAGFGILMSIQTHRKLIAR